MSGGVTPMETSIKPSGDQGGGAKAKRLYDFFLVFLQNILKSSLKKIKVFVLTCARCFPVCPGCRVHAKARLNVLYAGLSSET